MLLGSPLFSNWTVTFAIGVDAPFSPSPVIVPEIVAVVFTSVVETSEVAR
ncbi:hypothetical protein [Cryobacterium sp. PH31-O1]|nr:hypothetical protein [Cryobacterium sp. PH31-O1]MDJ0338564.1 hypothetical protein [Cryobacterium sp. PH31-O1]